jgi:hypothetical protein
VADTDASAVEEPVTEPIDESTTEVDEEITYDEVADDDEPMELIEPELPPGPKPTKALRPESVHDTEM